MADHVLVAAALEGAGWHPAAWRDPSARPADLTSLPYWRDLIREAERGGIDLVTIEDSFLLGSGEPDGRAVEGRLDALLIASAVAPATTRIGLVPTVTSTHTEPFHVATALQTLDHVSRGRAGWRIQVGARPAEARLFGRREVPDLTLEQLLDPAHAHVVADLFDEAADVVEVVRRLWDSWEDDAVIRDVETGRFLDRDRIHGADFRGRRFSVAGASIVPRSPQGQPPVFALAHREEPYELAAKQADVVLVTPHDDASAASVLRSVREAEERVGRVGQPLRAHAELVVLLEDTMAESRAALARLDDRAPRPLDSDALVLATTAPELIARIEAWKALGYDGFRLRPARLPDDLGRISRDLIPALDRAGLHQSAGATDLRTRLGLAPAPNRYAGARGASSPGPSSSPSFPEEVSA